MSDIGEYVWQEWTQCVKCNGTGKIVKIYKDPRPNEYATCFECNGLGFVTEKSKERTK